MIRSCFKNTFLPKQSPYRGDGVREGRLSFNIPFRASYLDTMTSCMFSEDKANYAEQPKQAWGCTQNRLGHILSRRFKTQMSPHFLKGRFDRPAGCKPTDNLLETKTGVGGIKVFVPVCTLNIMDKNPTNRNQSLACFVPLTSTTDKFDSTIRATVPTDRSGERFLTGYHMLRFWQFAALATRSTI